MSDSPPLPWTDDGWLSRVREFARGLEIDAEHDTLMVRAFTHRSLSEAAPHGDNERLEFLGDSVLALLVNEHLFTTFPDYAEGQLTKLKVRYVSEPSLAVAATALDLGSLLAIAPGDEPARERPSTLSDAFEAVLAALYLSRGLDAAREFLRRELIERVDPHEMWDYKSRLQELYQEKHRVTPSYRTAVEGGQPHAPLFRSDVVAGETVLGTGTGASKKVAEQAAAADALAKLETKPKKRSVRRKKLDEGATPVEAASPAEPIPSSPEPPQPEAKPKRKRTRAAAPAAPTPAEMTASTEVPAAAEPSEPVAPSEAPAAPKRTRKRKAEGTATPEAQSASAPAPVLEPQEPDTVQAPGDEPPKRRRAPKRGPAEPSTPAAAASAPEGEPAPGDPPAEPETPKPRRKRSTP